MSKRTIGFMAFNFFSSVSIIVVNKKVFRDGFSFGTFLTVIHFIFTFFGLHALSHLGWFEIKKVKFRQILPLVFAFCGFVVFNNLSLQYNSVGVYQLMKVLTTPVIAVVQTLFYDAPLDNRLKVTLIPICIGVGMATVNDLDLNKVGLTYAVLGLFSTSFYQIWVKTRQQDLGLNSYQLLYYQAPLSAVVVLFLVPIFDQLNGATGLLEYSYTIPALLDISFTAVLAFCVNISIYLVIGNTSPISYNVLGHFKLCVILLSGWLFFKEDMNSKKLMGTMLAFTGVVAYTTLKQYTENEWNRSKPSSSSTSTTQYAPLTQPSDKDNSLDEAERGKK
jgi:solute carrier family 35 protein E3